MTVESAPARLPWQGASRRRLSLPAAFTTMRAPAMLLACAAALCALGACSARDSDARAALTTNAVRELAQAQPGSNPQSPPLANAFTLASDASASNLPDSANSMANAGVALPANAVRSPAKPPAGGSAQDTQAAQIEPLVTPVIHTAD
ncbi:MULTISPECIES: hypothetical protein [Paraburkholderia]|uniref:hypothetical protein n=1 Tax=Paraburkholderia TaxID=1822464 RepID=UPI000483721D|nr:MULTISPECIES: hypothetical protein [Paraburkholderia]MCP3716511.1 hypothetical protein [Paraburkholderia sp. CNPSo 3281]MCX5539481.1 hypothetical protein [Paraburkholderia sp. CNPSo 3076]